MALILANNVAGVLAEDIAAGALALNLGDGGPWPAIPAGDHLYATLDDGAGAVEVVKVTSRAGVALTIERAQDGTVSRDWEAGAAVEMRLARVVLRELAAGAGLSQDAARLIAVGLLTSVPQFTYNAEARRLSFGLREADIPAGFAKLAGATFTGAVKGILPVAPADLATKAYVDAAIQASGGTPTPPADHFLLGLSADAVPTAAEATVPAPGGVGELPAFTDRHILIFRRATEGDISSVLFSDDDSSTNQVGAFTKYASGPVDISGTDYNVWVGNRVTSSPSPVTLTIR